MQVSLMKEHNYHENIKMMAQELIISKLKI